MSGIRDYVMSHALFCHHDHQSGFADFDKGRMNYDYRSLLGYATADLVSAAGGRYADEEATANVAELWPDIALTGYGRATQFVAQELFGMDYEPGNFPTLTQALQDYIRSKSAAKVYEELVAGKAGHAYTIEDGLTGSGMPSLIEVDEYLPSYLFTFRIDDLLAITSDAPIHRLEKLNNASIDTLDDLVEGLNSLIDRYWSSGKLAAVKIGCAYQRDLNVGEFTRSQAEAAFARIRSRGLEWGGVRQQSGAVNALEARPLADYMVHQLLRCADDRNLPVQFHTGYLAGNWRALAGSRALHLVPLFARYPHVRFDVFHASWPWTSELAAIAKNYPNVWVDMCWAWSMNPTQSEQALAIYLDAVPLNKIFAYGSDTRLPWMSVGYAHQARMGIARTLEQLVARGRLSESSARTVADAIMLENGKRFYGLD